MFKIYMKRPITISFALIVTYLLAFDPPSMLSDITIFYNFLLLQIARKIQRKSANSTTDIGSQQKMLNNLLRPKSI